MQDDALSAVDTSWLWLTAYASMCCAHCRVCVRYNGLVNVQLNGNTIVSSPASEPMYDATLVCHDVSNLQQGLLPLTVQYASGKPAAEICDMVQCFVLQELCTTLNLLKLSFTCSAEPQQQSVILQMFIIPVSQVSVSCLVECLTWHIDAVPLQRCHINAF